MQPILEILSTGVGLSIQDAGRAGWRRFGVPVGGAMDRYSLAAANRLLGNREAAPVLEIMLQGAKLKVLADTWLALAGADLGCGIEPWTAQRVSAGEVLTFPQARSGLFAYLAVPGGVVADHWFGSASVDARNGLGCVLQKGMQLSAVESAPQVSTEGVSLRRLLKDDRRDFDREVSFELLRGPQYALFSESAREALVASSWRVSARSDRTGFRLEGPVLEVPASIPSEPVLPGSFQVPGNGQPIVTMVDGPTVGGYAKLAVLRDADIDRLAQCAPGTQISFQWRD